jgi:hypothetical protein
MGKAEQPKEMEMALKLKDKYGILYIEGIRRGLYFRQVRLSYEYITITEVERLIQRYYGSTHDDYGRPRKNYRISYMKKYLKMCTRVNVDELSFIDDVHELDGIPFSTDAQLFIVKLKGRKWYRELLKSKAAWRKEQECREAKRILKFRLSAKRSGGR